MKILDILPPNGNLHAPHFRSRYQGMPEDYVFHILVTGDITLDGEQFAGATLHVQPHAEPWTRLTMLRRTWAMIIRGIRLARKERVDVVISYDPLTLGFIGMLVKLFSGAKLVVEVNGHLRDAKDLSLAGVKVGFLRRSLFNLVGSLSLFMADCVKILNRRQYEEWQAILYRKKVVMFHDYVPTTQFVVSERDESYLLCLGYPFYRKGVDVLLEAFAIVQPEFPDIKLIIMGHCREPELSRWKNRAQGVPNVEFRKPVPYDEVAEYLGACTALVVPSRSEGMGRVFIEAMATGKPCVGTRVGGIPNVIVDGRSGFLVSPEDLHDLADKLRILLSDKELRQRMGREGRRIAETVLSDKQYVINFHKMMDIVLGHAAVSTSNLSIGYHNMKNDLLTEKDEWKDHKKSFSVDWVPFGDLFKQNLIPDRDKTCLEIGCAPGRYLGFFNKNFGYQVEGIDYFEGSKEVTEKNLESVGIYNHRIYEEDFINWQHEKQYDIVCSFGFIEHFTGNLEKSVIQKHIELTKEGGTLILSVPNFNYGQYIIHAILDRQNLSQHNIKTMHLQYFRSIAKEYSLKIKYLKPYGGFFHFWVHPKKKLNIFQKVIFYSLKTIEGLIKKTPLRDRNNVLLSPYIILIAEKNIISNQ